MQSGAQANGSAKRAQGRSRGHHVAAVCPEPVASVCEHPHQTSAQAPASRAAWLADITVRRRGILINDPAIRK
jgi:hypothetical protein